jgi:tetratricopeptide (TPR) repeat protein
MTQLSACGAQGGIMLRLTFELSPIIIFMIVLIPVFATAQQKIDPERLEMAAAVKKLIEANDSYAAIEMVQEKGVFADVAQRYEFLVRDLYWQEKALHAVVPIANAGILYCLTKADELSEKDAEGASKMLNYAKIMSFNLSSFTWPGWDEKGIVITEHALMAGLEAAKLNLRLVEKLGGDHGQLSNSYWAIGAQYLALKDYASAITAFGSAAEYAKKSGSKDAELMNNGYIAMTKVLEDAEKEKAQGDFDKIVKALKDIGTDDANFFAGQLVSALEFFSR